MSKQKEKKVKVKFLLSPSGQYGLAYNIGEVGEFEEKQAQELVDAGFAQFTDDNGEVPESELSPLQAALVANENLKAKNAEYLKELEILKAAHPIPGTSGTLPVGATSGDLQTTLGTVEEAKAALNVSPATTEGDAAAEGALTVKTTAGTTDSNAVADAAGAEGAAAEGTGAAKTTGTTTEGNAGPGGAPSKLTKA